MSSDDTLMVSILNIYGALAIVVGQLVLGAISLAIAVSVGWSVFQRQRRWFLNRSAVAAARQAGWRSDEDKWTWTSPDGSTKICEVVLPDQWTIYRNGSYSMKEYPFYLALRWAMLPAESVPWVKMSKERA